MKRKSMIIVAACVAVTLAIAGIVIAQDSTERPYRKPQELLPGKFAGEKLIVGNATKAKLGEIPWQASVQIHRNGRTYQCGGSVIKPGWVLTAAHCVEIVADDELPPAQPPLVQTNQIDVRTGSIDVESGGLEAEPEAMFLMRDERNAGRNSYDVALLKVRTHGLAKPIALETAATANNGESLTVGTPLIVSGYGTTNEGGLSPKLLYVAVGYIRRQTCNSKQKHNGKIDATMICAGDDTGNDSCGGDSGGPLYTAAKPGQPARLIGIVSWGPKDCGNSRFPGVYTQVANQKIATWVRHTIAAN